MRTNFQPRLLRRSRLRRPQQPTHIPLGWRPLSSLRQLRSRELAKLQLLAPTNPLQHNLIRPILISEKLRRLRQRLQRMAVRSNHAALRRLQLATALAPTTQPRPTLPELLNQRPAIRAPTDPERALQPHALGARRQHRLRPNLRDDLRIQQFAQPDHHR